VRGKGKREKRTFFEVAEPSITLPVVTRVDDITKPEIIEPEQKRRKKKEKSNEIKRRRRRRRRQQTDGETDRPAMKPVRTRGPNKYRTTSVRKTAKEMGTRRKKKEVPRVSSAN
jgi:hypothetical protein